MNKEEASKFGRIRGDLTGVRGDLSGVRGNLSGVRGDLTGIRGNLSGVVGDLSGVRGDLSGVSGDLTGMTGNMFLFGPIGSRESNLVFNPYTGIFITGCFRGTGPELVKAAREAHGIKSVYYRQYKVAVAALKAVSK